MARPILLFNNSVLCCDVLTPEPCGPRMSRLSQPAQRVPALFQASNGDYFRLDHPFRVDQSCDEDSGCRGKVVTKALRAGRRTSMVSWLGPSVHVLRDADILSAYRLPKN